MIYALTTPSGRVFEFYIHSCARLYQGMYGGELMMLEGDIIDECAALECDQLELL
jgi:hypothetical protein